MITLFIDTSSIDVSIAIVKDMDILACIQKSIPNKHSVYTVDFIDKCLKDAKLLPSDINRIMVVKGPGSFTGVRIGVTIAKVYAYLKNIPIVVVSSLKMLSLSFNHNYCLSIIDAHHDNYYLGLYDSENNEVIDEKFGNKNEVLELIYKYNPVVVSNEEFSLMDDVFVQKQKLDFVKIVFYCKNYDNLNPHFVVPNYLKLPQALEKKDDQRYYRIRWC